MVTHQDAKLIIQIVRQTIEKTIQKQQIIIPEKIKDQLDYSKGLFITLTKNNLLRGSIGYVFPPYKLIDTTIRATRMAAFQDPRFPPIQLEEIADLDITLEIIEDMEHIKNEEALNKLNPKQHGILVEFGPYNGVITPQAAQEQKMTKEDILEQACLKANLAPNQWKKLATLYLLNIKTFKETNEIQNTIQ